MSTIPDDLLQKITDLNVDEINNILKSLRRAAYFKKYPFIRTVCVNNDMESNDEGGLTSNGTLISFTVTGGTKAEEILDLILDEIERSPITARYNNPTYQHRLKIISDILSSTSVIEIKTLDNLIVTNDKEGYIQELMSNMFIEPWEEEFHSSEYNLDICLEELNKAGLNLRV